MTTKSTSATPALLPRIESRIVNLRNLRVMIDADLATLYGVTTKRLNEQVKRNADRFPGDFMFKLTAAEKAEVVANCDHLAKLKFSKVLPYAFTEHGVAMLSAVLNSQRAVEMSILIVRAFVKLREVLASHKDLARKIEKLEATQKDHAAVLGIVIKDIQALAST